MKKLTVTCHYGAVNYYNLHSRDIKMLKYLAIQAFLYDLPRSRCVEKIIIASVKTL